jgi:O-antigen ligase
VVFAVILSVDWLVNAGSLAHQGFLEDRSYQNTARLISAGFIVLFGLLIFGRSGMTAWLLAGLGAVFFFYTLLITGARAPLIGLVLGAIVMMAMAVTIAGQRLFVRRGAGVAALVAAGLIIFLVLILQSGVETWTVRRMQGLLRFFSSLGSSGDSSAEVRALYIAAAFRYWGDSWQTIIIGNGLLSFTYLYAGKYVPGTNPHNIPLEILCEFGLVGFAIFAAFVASLFRYMSFRIHPGDHWTPVLIALCIAVVFFSVTSGDMINMFYFLVYGGLLPAIHGLRREDRRRRRQMKTSWTWKRRKLPRKCMVGAEPVPPGPGRDGALDRDERVGPSSLAMSPLLHSEIHPSLFRRLLFCSVPAAS